MNEENDILICMYQEHLKQARHQENQRSTMANLILIISTGLLGVIALDKTFSFSDLPLAIFLFFLGLYGAIFTIKYYERFKLHYERSRNIRKEFDRRFKDLGISGLQKEADKKTKEFFPIMFKLRLYWLWISLLLIVSILGLGLLLSIIVMNTNYIRLGFCI